LSFTENALNCVTSCFFHCFAPKEKRRFFSKVRLDRVGLRYVKGEEWIMVRGAQALESPRACSSDGSTEIERDVQTERQREKNRETGRPGGGLESAWLFIRPYYFIFRGGAAWTAASPRGGAWRARDGRLLRTVEPDVVTLQDLLNSAVHEWTAEVDRQRERQRDKESQRQGRRSCFSAWVG